MNNFCVYCHINKINGKKYIGLTGSSPEKRWGSNGINYKKCIYFYNAIQKYGWDNFEHKILRNNLTKEEAQKLESKYIKEFNTLSPNGYNLTGGGEYPNLVSDKTKKKMRESHLGQKLSKETREKMSQSRMGHKGYNCKPVWMCDKKTHKHIKFFESSLEASRFLNKESSAYQHIGHVCNGKRKSAYGYFWEFANINEKEDLNDGTI